MTWRALAFVLVLAGPALAEMPAPLTPHVSDFAGVLDDAAEARLTARLVALRAGPGVEVAVVTVARLADHGGSGLEPFATALFNAWGIGDATRNDGVLVLLAVEDRAARIELGAGWPPVWDNRARRVMEVAMVPQFAAGAFAQGLEAGVQGLEEYLITPYRAGTPVQGTEGMPAAPGGGGADFLAFLAFVALGFGWVFWRGRAGFGDGLARVRPCPACSRRGVVVERRSVAEAGETTPGMVTVSRRCPACDWHLDRSETVPSLSRQRSGSSGGGFGGGRSSGGGASGRW